MPRRIARRSAFFALATCLAIAPVSCGPVVPEPYISAGLTVAQVGTAAFYQGEMQAALRTPMTAAHQAALDSLAAWQLEIDNNIVTDTGGTITARELGGSLIEINVRRVSPVVSSLRIKVGLLGNQPVSRLLLDEISSRLAPPPPLTAPLTPPKDQAGAK